MFSREQYETVLERAGLLDRSPRGRLRLTGSDRRGYLHGLLTNDVASLAAGQGCYAALLTPQGRMISDMRVSELGDAVLLDLPGTTSETVRRRLADFIFSEDVEVADVQGSLAHLAVYGPRAAACVAGAIAAPSIGTAANAERESFHRMPVHANARCAFREAELVVVRSDDYGVPGFELFTAREACDELLAALRTSGAPDVSLATLEVCRIEGGRPEFGIDMDEHTIPLEAGIEGRAISMTKGCYVGQEIVVRVLHRGHGRVARHLVGLTADRPDVDFGRGDRLLAHDGGKEIGIVTSAAFSPRLERAIGLGYVHRDHSEPGTLIDVVQEENRQARRLTVAKLPFIPSAPE